MKQRKPRGGRGRDRRPSSPASHEQIYGLHAAKAALANPLRTISALYVTKNAATRLGDAIEASGLRPLEATAEQISSRLGGEAVHQGVLIETAPLPETGLDDILEGYGFGSDCGPIVILDQVTDPHNVGAVLRSAAAFGAAALVMTARHSPPLDGTLAKAASGALEHVPVARVTNLARAMEQIGDAGLLRIGLDSEAEAALEAAPLDAPCALVLGAEDKGLRRLTRENCDHLCRIATQGAIASLNISNAAAISLHACLAARRRTGSAQ